MLHCNKKRRIMEAQRKLLDDPVWPYIIKQRLEPYLPHVDKWWSEIEELSPFDTGVYPIEYSAEQPPGLFYRFTRTPVRSPIKGIQAFPFVVAAYLQITGVQGGSTKLVQWALSGDKFELDKYTLIELHNLPSIFNQGQAIAFVPTEMLIDSRTLGKWIYFTSDEISSLIRGEVIDTVRNKAIIKG
jgi:hypothetical protein